MSKKVMDWEGERVTKINEIWLLARIENQSKSWWLSMSKIDKFVKTLIRKCVKTKIVKSKCVKTECVFNFSRTR